MTPKELDELSDLFQHIRGRIQVLEGIAVALPTVDARKMQDAMLSAIGSVIDRAEFIVCQQRNADVPEPNGDVVRSLESVEAEHVLAVMKWVSGNKSKAARILGITRSTLDRKLRAYQQ